MKTTEDKMAKSTPNNQIEAAGSWSPDQKKMLREMFAKGASDQEFEALLATARVHNLNPFKREIHFVKRYDQGRESWTTQVGIDGFRIKADRTGLFEGYAGEPSFAYDGDGKLVSAKVGVYRKGWRDACYVTALYKEFVQTRKDGAVTKFWATMPHVMLSKVAEAQALRKAFPSDLAGIYAPEELGQQEELRGEVVPDPEPRAQKSAPMTGVELMASMGPAMKEEMALAKLQAQYTALANRLPPEVEGANGELVDGELYGKRIFDAVSGDAPKLKTAISRLERIVKLHEALQEVARSFNSGANYKMIASELARHVHPDDAGKVIAAAEYYSKTARAADEGEAQ